MNKQELINYCNVLKENKSRFINCIDVDRIVDTIKQLDEPKPVKVPQVVADWIEECKVKGKSLLRALLYTPEKVNSWVDDPDNQETFALAWIDGYTVEEEKKYKITLLNRNDGHLYLVNQNAGLADEYGTFSQVVLLFTKSTNFSEKCYELTKKDVVANGFGWVFSCEGIEVEEVE